MSIALFGRTGFVVGLLGCVFGGNPFLFLLPVRHALQAAQE